MAGWIYFVIAIGLLLGIGMVVDWRRRHSTRGLEERSAGDHGGGGGAHSCGGGCGGGGP